MKTYTRGLASLLRRYKRAARFAVLGLLILAWGGLKYMGWRRDQPPHAKLHGREIFNRAVGICTTLGDVCSVDTHPSFTDRRNACYPGDVSPLRMWRVICTVDGRQMAMIFNDDTGGLCYLVAERGHAAQSVNKSLATIENRQEAAEVGFQRLKAMKLLPHGSLVALNTVPARSRLHDVWEMTWNVKQNLQAAPYTIRLVLDSRTHIPVSVVDASNLRIR